jgi:hypothetical protein
MDTSLEGTNILALGYKGYLKKYDDGSDDDGTAINSYWKSGWLDWGMPERSKRLMRTTFLVGVEGDYSLNVALYLDWDWQTPLHASTVDLQADADSTQVIERRWNQSHYMRSMQLWHGTSDKNNPWTVHKIIIDYIQKGRTLVIK